MLYYWTFLIFGVGSGATSFENANEIPTVYAVTGGTANIPCNVPEPLQTGEASLILWYKLDIPNPIYTLDLRKMAIDGAGHFPADDLRGRVWFKVDVHPPTLVVNSVKAEDEGEYKCRVDMRRSRTLLLQSRLDVIVPPDDPIIMDEHGQRLDGVVGPYNEASSLTIICDVDGGDPSPVVEWWRNEVFLDGNFSSMSERFVRNELIVPSLRRDDWMAEYSCRASNTNLTMPKTATIKFDLNLLPTSVVISGHRSPLLSEGKYELMCESSGSSPPAVISWFLEDEQIDAGALEWVDEYDNKTISVLKFTPAWRDDGKTLFCKSANPAVPKTTVQANVSLVVHYAPIMKLTHKTATNDQEIEENEVVKLKCEIASNPPISRILWLFENLPLSSYNMSGILLANNTLLLTSSNRHHRGMYGCYSANSIGNTTSNSIRIRVKFAPVCLHEGISFLVIQENDTANVTCDVTADPEVTSYRWVFTNPLGRSILQDWNGHQTDNILTYSPAGNGGYGTLSCWSRNSIGAQKEPCQFKLVASGHPNPLVNCTILNQTMTSFVVSCLAISNESLPQTFHLEVYDSANERLMGNLSEVSKPVFQVDRLSPSTSYVLIAYASNLQGRGKSASLIGYTKATSAKDDDLIPISIILKILIAAVMIFFLVSSVVLCIVIAHWLKYSTIKVSAFQSSSQSGMPKKNPEENPDSKGPDIIPLSAEQGVFILNIKTEEEAEVSQMKALTPSKSVSTQVHRYQHTDL